jgi:hypothetical protein
VASLVSCAQKDEGTQNNARLDVQDAGLAAQLDAVSPSVDSINITFTCAAVDSIALRTMAGKSAWAVRRQRKNPITWVVPSNVTIDSIRGAPILPDGPQGGGAGTPYKSTVDSNATKTTHHYSIAATCNPGAGAPVHLVIDPEMIIH